MAIFNSYVKLPEGKTGGWGGRFPLTALAIEIGVVLGESWKSRDPAASTIQHRMDASGTIGYSPKKTILKKTW